MKTYMPNAKNTPERKWYVVDASNIPLGRLASQVAAVLRGKNKPTYTPHADMGDHVVVINAGKVVLTGNKINQKTYNYHTLYPGGDKQIPYSKLMETKSDFVVHRAVKGMMPKNSLGKNMLKKLRVYAGAEHPHAAQNPIVLNVKGGRA
ncbi:MAG: 50S ribosomal protein L13 [Firmicutes bacterium]|nr:50S ribosomal protein L13 [Bacillota bacterium]